MVRHICQGRHQYKYVEIFRYYIYIPYTRIDFKKINFFHITLAAAAMEFLVGRIPKENKDVTDSFKLTDTIKESSINQAGAEISGCRMC